MNIFILDQDFDACARYHVDKHVVKMQLELAQLLSTAHRVLDGDLVVELSDSGRKVKRWKLNDSTREAILYSATHINHPCAIWVRQSKENYEWTRNLLVALSKEYSYRYGKTHKIFRTDLGDALKSCPDSIKSIGLTKFAQAMPDEFKHADAVEAYRRYYNGAKQRMHSWKKRDVPSWIQV